VLLAFSIGGLVSAGLVMHSTARMTPGEFTQPANLMTASDAVGVDAAPHGEPGVFSSGGAPLNRPQPPSRLDEVLQVLDADLGDEGIPVDRQEIEAALRADPALAGAILE
jgi:hypothetical protein